MSTIRHILMIVFVAFAALACDENGKVDTSNLSFTQLGNQKDSIHPKDDEAFNEIRYDRLENRLRRNVRKVNIHLARLQHAEAEEAEFSEQARETAEQLKKDLVRIKNNLQHRLSMLKENSENSRMDENIANGLEQMEDELSQIEEEIAEWMENH